MSRMQVNIRVRESQIDKIARNMKAEVRIDAFVGRVLNGRVIDVAPLPDSASVFGDKKVFITKVWVENRLPGLRPGMTAEVKILVSELDDVLCVPVEAVVRYDDKDHVAVKKPDSAIEWREVKLGQSNNQLIEVKQGVNNGELVVVKPHALLSEEQKRKMSGTANERGVNPSTAR
jgi:HlyD family secretion protein